MAHVVTKCAYFTVVTVSCFPYGSCFALFGSSHRVGPCGPILMAICFSFIVFAVVATYDAISMAPTIALWIQG
jgi:hypothetical protein